MTENKIISGNAENADAAAKIGDKIMIVDDDPYMRSLLFFIIFSKSAMPKGFRR